jgi:hypothetical protein
VIRALARSRMIWVTTTCVVVSAVVTPSRASKAQVIGAAILDPQQVERVPLDDPVEHLRQRQPGRVNHVAGDEDRGLVLWKVQLSLSPTWPFPTGRPAGHLGKGGRPTPSACSASLPRPATRTPCASWLMAGDTAGQVGPSGPGWHFDVVNHALRAGRASGRGIVGA